ncbi:uncharacterized protein [Montipora foliosa]|uniref:uncharacterized protein n=1 Tax=Montipora foliosa TaxID=591990 RepID=UPI0035F19826
MLVTKGFAVSNVENTVIGPKTVVLPSGQEVTVTSPTITTPYQYLPTTSQQEFSQANQLSSIEEDSAKDNPREINLEDDNGNTPLCIATQMNHLAVVDILLRHSMSVNSSKKNPMRHRSAGGDVHATDDQGNTPLHRAVLVKDIPVINVLTERGASVNFSNSRREAPLHNASGQIDMDSLDVMRTLISSGASVNIQDNTKKGPLHHACKSAGMCESIKLLIHHGAQMDAQDLKGYYPLHHLIDSFPSTGKEEKLLEMIDCFQFRSVQDVNVTTATGQTALHLAACNGLHQTIKHLISCGCNVHHQDGRGKNALHCAVADGGHSISTLETLVSAGADVCCCDWWGMSPLHEAARNDNVAAVDFLIENGAQVNLKDKNGAIALHLAATCNCREIVEVLIKKGSSVNATDKNLSTPLHFAAWADSEDIREILLDKGADLTMKDRSGSSPLDTAVLSRSKNFLRLFATDAKFQGIRSFSNFGNVHLPEEDLKKELLSSSDGIRRPESDIPKFVDGLLSSPGVGQAPDSDEAQEVHSAVESMVQDVVNKLAHLDPRFATTLLRAGSSSEGSKTVLPNEFDFMFSLDEMSSNIHPIFLDEDTALTVGAHACGIDGKTIAELFENKEVSEHTGVFSDYVQIFVNEGHEASRFLDLCESTSREVTSYARYIYFSQLLTKVLLSSSFPKHPNLLIKEVTIDPAIHLEWRGCRFKLLEIHVDAVPAIRLPHWPEKTCRNRRLLTPDILTIPCLAVPKMASVNEHLWRCSTSLQETAIFRKLRPCIRNSYVAAKAIVNSKAVCPSVACRNEESIELFRNTYLLSPDDDVYITKLQNDVSLLIRRQKVDVDLVKDIFRRCEACLFGGFVSSFFNPKQNVIEKKEDGEEPNHNWSDEVEVNSLSASKLKLYLKEHGLPVSGGKAVLVARVLGAGEAQGKENPDEQQSSSSERPRR